MSRRKRIRLACEHCFRDDCDGVLGIPPGWEDVHAASVDADDDWSWWTHLGTCTACAAEIRVEAMQHQAKGATDG